MRGFTPQQLQEAFGHLQVSPRDFLAIRQAQSLQAAQERLAELKERVKRRWKQLAFELHPDRTEGDEAKEKLFKLLSQVVKQFAEVKVTPPPRRVPFRRVVMQQPITWTTNSSTSSTNTWGNWVPGGVVTQVWVNGRRVS